MRAIPNFCTKILDVRISEFCTQLLKSWLNRRRTHICPFVDITAMLLFNDFCQVYCGNKRTNSWISRKRQIHITNKSIIISPIQCRRLLFIHPIHCSFPSFYLPNKMLEQKVQLYIQSKKRFVLLSLKRYSRRPLNL